MVQSNYNPGQPLQKLIQFTREIIHPINADRESRANSKLRNADLEFQSNHYVPVCDWYFMSDAAPQARKPHDYSVTPDGRYFVVRGRLWRKTNPALCEIERSRFTKELMVARRAVATAGKTGDTGAMASAREAVDQAKRKLGERGPVWWNDDAPDFSRHMARSTPYAAWYEAL